MTQKELVQNLTTSESTDTLERLAGRWEQVARDYRRLAESEGKSYAAVAKARAQELNRCAKDLLAVVTKPPVLWCPYCGVREGLTHHVDCHFLHRGA
jgi:hypothetical protein